MKSHIFAVLVGLCALTLLVPAPARAGSATWSGQLNSNWNVFQNWSPQTVPNGPNDTATLGGSFNRTVYLSANTDVNSITFPKPFSPFIAVNYGITVNSGLTLTISGTGITNISGQAQNFVLDAGGANTSAGRINFTNSATAGSAIFTTNGAIVTETNGGSVIFDDTSSAGFGVFTNNGGQASSTDGGLTLFTDNSTAGNGTFTNNGGSNAGGSGTVDFAGSTTAANGTFTNNGGPSGGVGGLIHFESNSSAGNGTFINNGALQSGTANAVTFFEETATAGDGTFTNNGGMVSGASGGEVDFDANSSAASATLIANDGSNGGFGGLLFFAGNSSGGSARIALFGNGSLDISAHNGPGVAVGSIQGSGQLLLGSYNLTVGVNNLSTVFSGLIDDGGSFGGAGGSLTKVGNGKLTLSKGSFYTGGTAIDGGTLLLQNKNGSATGYNAVQVNKGTLGGTGIINGMVTVGTGTMAGAILLAGNGTKTPGNLTIRNKLTFRSMSGYKCGLKRTTSSTGQVSAVAGKINALGVTIASNVAFTFVDSGTGTLPIGTLFTVINNTSASPISGRFSNLVSGSTFRSNGNTFKVSYTGGTGNDLTLKVVQ